MSAPSPHLLAFGDSLTAGYGLAPEMAFPEQLERLLRDQLFGQFKIEIRNQHPVERLYEEAATERKSDCAFRSKSGGRKIVFRI